MTTTISTRQLVGQSYAVRVNGSTVGIVTKKSDRLWYGVAGHVKLGSFPTKVEAVDAVAAEVAA